METKVLESIKGQIVSDLELAQTEVNIDTDNLRKTILMLNGKRHF